VGASRLRVKRLNAECCIRKERTKKDRVAVSRRVQVERNKKENKYRKRLSMFR